MKSNLFPSLNDINFCSKDPDTITRQVISRFELFTGRSLARADPVRLFLNAIILEFVQQRNSVDFAAKMNLIAYAQGDYLDHLGAFYGVRRLEASSATCIAAFTLSAPLSYSIDIPIGTTITPDGKIYFSTTELMTIPAGQTQSESICICTAPGTVGNDYVPGQISKLVDPFPYELKCENINTSGGGTDTEDDEAFRERIQLAPESFSTAGTKGGYRYYALSADPNVADVSVLTPHDDESIPPGNIYIYVLMKDGIIPDDEELQKVFAACSAEDIRTDTDYVHVFKPETVEYTLNAQYWIDVQDAARSESIQLQVEEAVRSWIKWQRSALGRDINPARLVHDIVAAGAKRCEIISPTYNALKPNQTSIVKAPFFVSFGGLD